MCIFAALRCCFLLHLFTNDLVCVRLQFKKNTCLLNYLLVSSYISSQLKEVCILKKFLFIMVVNTCVENSHLKEIVSFIFMVATSCIVISQRFLA